MSFTVFITVTALLLDLLCIIAVIFFERKNPTSTISWVMVLVFLPFIGFIGYLLFGSGFHVNKKRRYELKRVSDSIYKALISSYLCIYGGTGKPENCESDSSRLVRYLEQDGMCLKTNDNEIETFLTGKTLFPRLIEDLEKAEKHIHLLTYIINNDSLGRKVVDVLTKKAKEGVEVRLLYDSLGSLFAFGGMFNKLRAAGGEVSAFSPLLFTLNLSSHLRLNYRNHRKVAIIDGLVGYTGGMNIGNEYLGLHEKLTPWRDTHMRLTGSSVQFLQERFIMDWCFNEDMDIPKEGMEKYFPQPEIKHGLGVQIASSGPDTPKQLIKSGMLEMLYSAKKNIYIQTPYFTPDDSFLDGLRIAARSGVDVKIMLPGKPDHASVQFASLSFAWEALDAGVQVYLYNGFLHAKTIVIDGEIATIGSTNIGNRSFVMNFELNAFIHDKKFALEQEGYFIDDLTHCRQITSKWFENRHPLIRVGYSVARLFAPIM